MPCEWPGTHQLHAYQGLPATTNRPQRTRRRSSGGAKHVCRASNQHGPAYQRKQHGRPPQQKFLTVTVVFSSHYRSPGPVSEWGASWLPPLWSRVLTLSLGIRSFLPRLALGLFDLAVGALSSLLTSVVPLSVEEPHAPGALLLGLLVHLFPGPSLSGEPDVEILHGRGCLCFPPGVRCFLTGWPVLSGLVNLFFALAVSAAVHGQLVRRLYLLEIQSPQ